LIEAVRDAEEAAVEVTVAVAVARDRAVLAESDEGSGIADVVLFVWKRVGCRSDLFLSLLKHAGESHGHAVVVRCFGSIRRGLGQGCIRGCSAPFQPIKKCPAFRCDLPT